MAISFVSGAAAIANTVTMPSHQAGDYIVVFAYSETAAVIPTLVSGYTSLNAPAAGNSNGHRLAGRIATSSSETVGTWTNATQIAVAVYRGVNQTTPTGGVANLTNVVDINYPAITLADTSGSSWVVAIHGRRTGNVTDPASPPGTAARTDSGMSGAGRILGFDTNGGVTTWPQVATGGSNTFRYRSISLELRAEPSTGISGTASITEQSDTAAATSGLAVRAVAGISEADDTIAASAAIRIAATTSLLEAGDTLTATGTLAAVGISGTLSVTEAGDTVSSASTARIAATATILEAGDTLSASGVLAAVGISGTLTVTEEDDTAAATATVRITATAAILETGDTLAATGVLSAVSINGTLAVTEADDTLAAYGFEPDADRWLLSRRAIAYSTSQSATAYAVSARVVTQ